MDGWDEKRTHPNRARRAERAGQRWQVDQEQEQGIARGGNTGGHSTSNGQARICRTAVWSGPAARRVAARPPTAPPRPPHAPARRRGTPTSVPAPEPGGSACLLLKSLQYAVQPPRSLRHLKLPAELLPRDRRAPPQLVQRDGLRRRCGQSTHHRGAHTTCDSGGAVQRSCAEINVGRAHTRAHQLLGRTYRAHKGLRG